MPVTWYRNFVSILDKEEKSSLVNFSWILSSVFRLDTNSSKIFQTSKDNLIGDKIWDILDSTSTDHRERNGHLEKGSQSLASTAKTFLSQPRRFGQRCLVAKSWTEVAEAISLASNQLLTCYVAWISMVMVVGWWGESFQICTAKNILGIAHPKHTILLLVSRKLEGNSGYFALLVASNQIYCLSEMIFLN